MVWKRKIKKKSVGHTRDGVEKKIKKSVGHTMKIGVGEGNKEG